jgi:hypothetical protein
MAEENEVLGENLPQYNSAHHKSHITCLGFNLGHCGGKLVTNRMNYSTTDKTQSNMSYLLEKNYSILLVRRLFKRNLTMHTK